jgi:hypothetical protein
MLSSTGSARKPYAQESAANRKAERKGEVRREELKRKKREREKERKIEGETHESLGLLHDGKQVVREYSTRGLRREDLLDFLLRSNQYTPRFSVIIAESLEREREMGNSPCPCF